MLQFRIKFNLFKSICVIIHSVTVFSLLNRVPWLAIQGLDWMFSVRLSSCLSQIFCLAPCPGPVWAAPVGPLPLGSGLDLVHVVPLGVEGGWTVKSGYFALTPCCWVTVEWRCAPAAGHISWQRPLLISAPTLTPVITPLASLGLGAAHPFNLPKACPCFVK